MTLSFERLELNFTMRNCCLSSNGRRQVFGDFGTGLDRYVSGHGRPLDGDALTVRNSTPSRWFLSNSKLRMIPGQRQGRE